VEESESLYERLKDDPKQFFKHMEVCIESEVERAKAVLPVSAWSTVREFAETAAWKGRMEWVAKNSKLTYPWIPRVLNTRHPYSTSDVFNRTELWVTRPDVYVVHQSWRDKGIDRRFA